jgi:signal transduction histidine kinase
LASLAYLRHDRLLLGVVAACIVLLSFQLLVILLQPPWGGPTTDWLRAALVWPELLIMVTVSCWLSCRRRLEALVWWLFSGGVLCYAIARTWWTVDAALSYHSSAPFPILPDLFFVLQFPCYFLAVILIPFARVWGPRLLVLLDALLWIVAAAAFLWYFVPPSLTALGHRVVPLAKAVSLGYPVADFFLLLALVLIVLRLLRHGEDRPLLGILMAAVVCLVVADIGATLLILHPDHEDRVERFPDLVWLAADLLIPLAAIVQVRMVQREGQRRELDSEESRTSFWDTALPGRLTRQRLQRLQRSEIADVAAVVRFLLPLVVALLASVAILLRAAVTATAAADWQHMIVPLVVTALVLLLINVRLVAMFLETAQLRYATVAAQAEEQALRALDRRKEEFLAVLSHELKTPLTSLLGYIQLLAQRFHDWRPEAQGPDELTRTVVTARTVISYSETSVHRMTRLVNDLVDDTCIHDGRLVLQLALCDLRTVVQEAVAEQRVLVPDRTITEDLPTSQRVSIMADADRIGQVVTNYLTNALKYSKEDQPVAVCLEVDSTRARVSVRDEGPGVPLSDQAHVWERFHRIEGMTVQSGSGISLGLGLHICKTIIEQHHGEVGLDSTPCQQGTTFWFTLPLALSTHPALPSASSAATPDAG